MFSQRLNLRPESVRLAAFLISGVFLAGIASAGQLEWETQSVQLKAGYQDNKLTASYPFTNTSDAPVTITNIRTTCGCTTTELDKKTYQPGEGGTIDAVFTVGNRSGIQQKKIYVYTTDPNEKMARLDIRVDIQSVVALEDSFLRWEFKEGAELKPKTTIIRIDEEADVALLGVDSTHDFLRPHVRKLFDKAYQLTVTPKHLDQPAYATIRIDLRYPGDIIKVEKIHARVR